MVAPTLYTKKEECGRTPLFLDFFVHGYCVVFANIVGNHQDLHGYGSGTQGDFNFIAGLDLVAGFHHTTVDTDASVVARLIGNGAALYQPGDLQVFVQTHLT